MLKSQNMQLTKQLHALRQVVGCQKKLVTETQTTVELMEQVCKEWAIKDDALSQRMKSIKSRFTAVINAERAVFNKEQIDGRQDAPELAEFVHFSQDDDGTFGAEKESQPSITMKLDAHKILECEQQLHNLWTLMQDSF